MLIRSHFMRKVWNNKKENRQESRMFQNLPKICRDLCEIFRNASSHKMRPHCTITIVIPKEGTTAFMTIPQVKYRTAENFPLKRCSVSQGPLSTQLRVPYTSECNKHASAVPQPVGMAESLRRRQRDRHVSNLILLQTIAVNLFGE
jgi:hypothetical protein